jgi:hypothetical protein
MKLLVFSTAGTNEHALAQQLLRSHEDVMVLSRDPWAVASMVNRRATVRYLGPWGSLGAFLVERFA